MSDLVVVVPSRGRPDNAKRLINAFHATSTMDSKLVFALDEDDPQLEFYPEDGPLAGRIDMPEWQPMVKKLNYTAEAAGRTARIVGFMGDDHLPITPGWDWHVVNALLSMDSGYVYCNDLMQGHQMATSWFVTSDIVREIGMVPAPVEHLYCDNAVMAVGEGAECLRYLGDVAIEHLHPMADKAPWDHQYRRVNSQVRIDEDRRAYARWQQEGLPGCIDKVRELRRA